MGAGSILVERLGARGAGIDVAAAERALEGLCARGAAAWPGIALAPEVIAEHVAARLPADGEVLAAIAELHAEGLYITCACARGDAGALAAIEERYAGEIGAALGRVRMDAGSSDEARQRLRQKLFVAADGGPPRIATYTGRGDLGRWLRVAATREALNVVRKQQREVPTEDDMLDGLVSPAESQELQFLKGQYRGEFKAAFQAAFAALEPRQRTILRYYTVDGHNIDEIGAVYGVHRATVARWIENIRHTLLEKTRETLMARIRVNRAEFESIMRLIQSQLDVSMHRLLAEGGDDRRSE